MSDLAINYRVLREQRHWDDTASLSSLALQVDGAIVLDDLPGLISGGAIKQPAPYSASTSGLACGKGRTSYSAITSEEGQILISECGCAGFEVFNGATDSGLNDKDFKFPRGLLVVGEKLFVADSGNSRILVLDLPSLHKLAEWASGLHEPTCLAADNTGRVYVLDSGRNKVLRFSAMGEADANFSVAVSAPAGIAIDAQNSLYVSAADSILRFDINGIAHGSLNLPASSFKPRAMAARGRRLYVADAASGFIWACDTQNDTWLGKMQAYRGPVAAMALEDSGALLLKPGQDEMVYRLDAGAARVEVGTLLAGPLDAGEGDVWERVWIAAEIPPETEVLLEVAGSDVNNMVPGIADWVQAPALDVLLRTLVSADDRGLNEFRFIWLRVTLKSHDGRSSPQLLQVQASTAQPDYLDYLPSIYRRDDAATGFLERWLALFRAELGDWDRALEELPREFDALTVEEVDIGRLAAWIALDLPARMAVPEQRQLLADATLLYRQRGTPAGLREMVRRNLGVTIQIHEAFRERRVWQLDEGLGLGFDTALAAGTPDGVIVPGFTYADSQLAGLRGSYYAGKQFETLRYTRVDKIVDFNWSTNSPLAAVPSQSTFPADDFSVRWSGQVRPRYTETYTFRTVSDDGVRLRVGGRLIIENWTDHPAQSDIGQIKLEAGRWYPIELEFYEHAGGARIELHWSSMSQRQEIVPQECLYSVLDDTAEFAPQGQGSHTLHEVGHAIVGESRPQAAGEYGAALVDDYAHLFTVMVAAAQVPLASQRQALRDLIEAEKPAHTDFRLCLVEPSMRAGVQARVGIDSIVAGTGPVMRLGSGALGLESYLGGGGASPA